jgi:predicted O-methyltransferase YrrM
MKKNNIWKILILILCHLSLVHGHPMRPIPWVTHKAVLFLEHFMKANPNAHILEFGSGSSTIWFAKKTAHLVSVEHSEKWFSIVDNILKTTPECFPVQLVLHERPYYTVCNDFPDEFFDLVLVDGRNRSGCIKYAIRILKRGGILMLDNAERPYYQKAIKLLKGWKEVSAKQVGLDSCGFTYPNWTTNWYIKP